MIDPTILIEQYTTIFVIGIIVIGVWDAVWKGLGLWASARNKQLAWFLLIFVLNTMGILPIVYLVWFQKKRIIFKK